MGDMFCAINAETRRASTYSSKRHAANSVRAVQRIASGRLTGDDQLSFQLPKNLEHGSPTLEWAKGTESCPSLDCIVV
jgi:hypothetical protein